MQIGELAARTGASARSLRHYEAIGLIDAVRSENGYRHYADDCVDRVKAVRFFIASGISTRTIVQILPTIMSQKCKLSDRAARKAVEDEAERVASQIDRLDETLALLRNALARGEIRRTPPGGAPALERPASNRRRLGGEISS